MSVTIPEQREHEITTAILTLQEQGKAITNDNVYALVKGGRGFVVSFMKQFRANQRSATPPVAPTPPVPRPGPVPYLVAMRQLCTEDAEAKREWEREGQELHQAIGEHTSAYRAGLQEARRLHPLFLHALQARQLPIYRGNEQVESDYERLRTQLTALVGEADTALIASGGTPWWLTGER